MASSRSQKHEFVQGMLPVLIGAGALLLYLFTLNRSVTLGGLPSLARAAGWDWHPVFTAPLTFLLTWPVQWVPTSLKLIALNLPAAICAAFALAFLARTVALLPHDRTRRQRECEQSSDSTLSIGLAWLPPLFAVMACGLQLTFWENAILGTGEALNLLVFAYLVRCLAEYRTDHRDAWLYRLALVYGLGLTNNVALLGFLPMLLVALVWLQGFEFLRVRVLGLMTLLLLAGMSLYLLLPCLLSNSTVVETDFWTALRINLGAQKVYLLAFPRYLLLLTGLTSLLPLLLMAIRWPDSHGDVSATGAIATEIMLHIMHFAFLGLCVWVAFDPPFSPRLLGRGMVSFLTLYYLSALCVGYFSGYFLLIFGERRAKFRSVSSSWMAPLSGLLVAVVLLGSVVTPVLLLVRNLPKISLENTRELERYVRQLVQALPAKKPTVVLSDDPNRLFAFQALLDGSLAGSVLCLDTGALPLMSYQRHLAKLYPRRWSVPKVPSQQKFLTTANLLENLSTLSASNDLWYLHPSFGYYFERFQMRPQGLIYQLQPRSTNTVAELPLSAAELVQNETLWKNLEANALTGLERRLRELAQGRDPAQLFFRQDSVNYTLVWTAAAYSRALNYWGVQLQKLGHYEQAAGCFRKAGAVNPSNPSAFVNLEFSLAYQKTHRTVERFSEEAMQKLRPYQGNVDLLYAMNGPIDEPTFRGEVVGPALIRSEFYHQAELEYLRALEISPNDFGLRLTLGQLLVQSGQAERALQLVEALRTQATAALQDPTNRLNLVQIEAWAYFMRKDLPRAEKLLLEAQQQYPGLDSPFSALAQIYSLQAGQYRAEGRTNEARQQLVAVRTLFERQIQAQPHNLAPQVNHGGVCVELGEFERAFEGLSHTLQLDPTSVPARINRALACLRAGRFDAARQDYLELLRAYPTMLRAKYGLAEAAWQNQNWAEAKRWYKEYLRSAPPEADETSYVKARVDQLERKGKKN